MDPATAALLQDKVSAWLKPGAEIKNRLEHGQGAIPPMLHWCKATY